MKGGPAPEEPFDPSEACADWRVDLKDVMSRLHDIRDGLSALPALPRRLECVQQALVNAEVALELAVDGLENEDWPEPTTSEPKIKPSQSKTPPDGGA